MIRGLIELNKARQKAEYWQYKIKGVPASCDLPMPFMAQKLYKRKKNSQQNIKTALVKRANLSFTNNF